MAYPAWPAGFGRLLLGVAAQYLQKNTPKKQPSILQRIMVGIRNKTVT
jgi:uncharacterized protein with HEPN domain